MMFGCRVPKPHTPCVSVYLPCICPRRPCMSTLSMCVCVCVRVFCCRAGDPTLFGNFATHPAVTEAVVKCAVDGKHNGYLPSHGSVEARRALARFYTTDDAPLTERDVIIASACSGAIDLAITALASEGQNILIPAPGFSLYETLAISKGIAVKKYRLLVRVVMACFRSCAGRFLNMHARTARTQLGN
jgi:hypothetical protein